MKPERFSISITDEVLADLRERLARVRWPDELDNENWQYGTNLSYMKELVDYWLHVYDWRQHEREMNQYEHYRTEIDGHRIHFIHERGRGPKPIPLVLNHGWPWTFWDFNKVIRPLSDPEAFGGDPADAFDVIVPSLPGYGFSTPLQKSGQNFWRTADLWVKLMNDVLGYEKFGVQGGDWGALLSAQLGHKYADKIIGLHLEIAPPLSVIAGDMPAESDYSPEELPWFERNQTFWADDGGYFSIQTTRPQTLAYGPHDSPTALCAWILEKRRSWGDCGGNVESRFTKDELLTTMTLYWVTESFNSAARYYYEGFHHQWKPSHDRMPVVEAPTGITVFVADNLLVPRRWAERYYNLKHWNIMPKGGHFAPMEEPEMLVDEIRTFFRPLR